MGRSRAERTWRTPIADIAGIYGLLVAAERENSMP